MQNVQIHGSAIVESDRIGEGTRIWAFTHILKGAVIGRNANICDHCFIENMVAIGDDVTIKCGVYLWDGITVENNVFIGPTVTFANDAYPRSKNKDFHLETTLLKVGCSIGSNATILPNITIGAHALVGAGSVVTKDVGDFCIVVGNPARTHGHICACGKRLAVKDAHATCACGKRYTLHDDVMTLL